MKSTRARRGFWLPTWPQPQPLSPARAAAHLTRVRTDYARSLWPRSRAEELAEAFALQPAAGRRLQLRAIEALASGGPLTLFRAPDLLACVAGWDRPQRRRVRAWLVDQQRHLWAGQPGALQEESMYAGVVLAARIPTLSFSETTAAIDNLQRAMRLRPDDLASFWTDLAALPPGRIEATAQAVTCLRMPGRGWCEADDILLPASTLTPAALGRLGREVARWTDELLAAPAARRGTPTDRPPARWREPFERRLTDSLAAAFLRHPQSRWPTLAAELLRLRADHPGACGDELCLWVSARSARAR